MRPFSYKQQELNEISIPFYTRIGLLSVRFAEIESLVTHIIEKFINSDNELISNVLIENNSLDRNLQLLLRININRSYEEDKISEMVDELISLKDIRNSFIHGVWSDVENKDGETHIYCSNHKHIYKKLQNGRGHQWTRYSSKKYTVEDLNLKIIKAEKILLGFKKIWEDLQEVDF